jgi:type I restriction enzyme M protein
MCCKNNNWPPENIRQGSSLSEDGFQGEKFDYMLTNPPYGVSWSSESNFIIEEKGNPTWIKDTSYFTITL